MAKKERADSAHKASEIMKAAQRVIDPPLPLSKEERPYFDKIVAAKLEWNAVDFLIACELAYCLHSLTVNRLRLEAEGIQIDTPDGKIIHPLFGIVDKQTRLSLSLMRSLNVHAAATQGRARDQRTQNTRFREAQEALGDNDDDNLIARPTEH